jgi:hypothetical protein
MNPQRNQLATTTPVTFPGPPALLEEFDARLVEVARTMIAKDLSTAELYLYLHTAKAAGLDPRFKQIYAIKDNKGRLSITPSIDGMRLIAARTGRYAAGPIMYTFDTKGDPETATATTRVWNEKAQQWIEVEGYAWMRGSRRDTAQWNGDPMNQLGIAAERRSLKRAFPLDLQGLGDDGDGFAEDLGSAVQGADHELPCRTVLTVDAVPEPAPPPAGPVALGAAGKAARGRLVTAAKAKGMPLEHLSLIRESIGLDEDPATWTAQDVERLRAEIGCWQPPAQTQPPTPTTDPAAPLPAPAPLPPAPGPMPTPPAAPQVPLGVAGLAEKSRLIALGESLGLRSQDVMGLRAGCGLPTKPEDWTAAQVATLEARIREQVA